jgi:copper chaperone CopZ
MSDHANCHVEPLEKQVDPVALASAEVAYLAVWGMGCPRCATRVRNGLLGLDGVLTAEIFLADGLAVAAYDPARIVTEDLVTAVAAAGNDGRHRYQARMIQRMPAAARLW